MNHRHLGLITICVMALALLAMSAQLASAQTTFQAFLSGLNEVPPNAGAGTGFGTVVLNAAQTQITCDLSWAGLLASATAAHIQGPAPTTANGPVVFAFSGVPGATSGAIPEQTFAISAAQVANLQAGLYYMNVHTSAFPGGEIRGQLYRVDQTAVPEPSAFMLGGLGLSTVAGILRRRRSQ